MNFFSCSCCLLNDFSNLRLLWIVYVQICPEGQLRSKALTEVPGWIVTMFTVYFLEIVLEVWGLMGESLHPIFQ